MKQNLERGTRDELLQLLMDQYAEMGGSFKRLIHRLCFSETGSF